MYAELAALIQFGSKIKAHGQDWIKLYPIGIDCFLAIKADETEMPCQVYLIRPEKNNAS